MKSLIVYDPAPNNDLANRAITSVCLGLKKLGVDFKRKPVSQYEPSGLAVVVGWLKKILNVKGGRAEVINSQREKGLDLLILERAWLKDRDAYHSFSWNGMGGYGKRPSKDMPPDRWEKLGLEMKPWRKEGKHILICAQVPWDSQVDGGDHVGWVRKTVIRLKELTDRPIVLRLHPKIVRMGVRKHFPLGELEKHVDRISHPPKVRPTMLTKSDHGKIRTSLSKDLDNCWALVAFNSNAGVDALLEGIPVFLFDNCGRSYPIANHDLADIETPSLMDREQWVYDLAYDQWNNAELESGEAWKHLMRGTEWAV